MKKQKKIAAALGALTVSSAFLSGCRPVQEVYGPPPAPSPTQFQASQNIPAPVYGPPATVDPTFSPEEIVPEDVYGPPMPYEEEDIQQAAEGDALTEQAAEPEK